MRVLGIDPGLNITGYGVVDRTGRRLAIVEAGVIRPGRAGHPLENRLAALASGLEAVLEDFRPEAMSLEEVFSHRRFPLAALWMAHARGALEPEFIKRVGMDAEYSAAFSAYEPRAATPGNAVFVKAYSEKYKLAPDAPAAQGWAAGKVLEAAVLRAGSFEQERLRAAFATLETDSVLGGYKVAADGSQLAASGFLVQILKGKREVLWPEAYRSSAPVAPAPEWARRSPKPPAQ